MRSHRTRTAGLAPCEGAQPAINTACAWWPIMPAMNRTSAAVYGGRPPSAPACAAGDGVVWETVAVVRSEEHTSELQSQFHLVCRLLLEKKKRKKDNKK